jgi:hypothetical protein
MRKPAFGSVKALCVSQRSWGLDGGYECVRQPPLPTRERGIGRPTVVARVQLHGLKLPSVVIKAALGRQAFGVEDIRPLRVTPAGSSDVDCHNGYSAIREQLASRCANRRVTLRVQQAGFFSRCNGGDEVLPPVSRRRQARKRKTNGLISKPAAKLIPTSSAKPRSSAERRFIGHKRKRGERHRRQSLVVSMRPLIVPGLVRIDRCRAKFVYKPRRTSRSGKPVRLPRRDIVMISRSKGRSQSLYIAHWRLSEDALVLPIELAWTFVSHLEGRTRSIKFLCEHLLPCCMEPKLFLKLKRTHRCETMEVMMQS